MRSETRNPCRSGPWAPVMFVLVLSGFLCDPAGALRQLTSDPDYDMNPDWSPDGSQIAFMRWDSAGAAMDLYLVDASGGTPRSIPRSGERSMSWPAWSPNGEYIAASRSLDEEHDAIIVIELSEGTRSGLVGGGPEEYRSPTWSPDGGWIAFDRYYNHASEIGVVPSIGGRPKWIISDGSSPAWSPDSTMIAFTRWNIWIASSTGENQRQLTNFPGGAGSPSWSPDSRYIAFDSNHSGNQDIWIVPVLEGEPTQLTTDLGWDSDPTWSPHGDEIAFSSTPAAGGGPDIWVLEVNLTPTQSTSWGKLKTLLR